MPLVFPTYFSYRFFLKLSSDEMYLTAIRNLARSSVGPAVPCDLDSDPNISGLNVNEGPSQLVKNYNSEKAKSMLYAVNNKEMAIAAAKWIAQNLPLGNEMVAFSPETSLKSLHFFIPNISKS